MSTSVWDFLISFFVLFAGLSIIIIVIVFKAKPQNQENYEDRKLMTHEKVIVKEIVKIRCRYCGVTYEQGMDNCPNCGART